MHNLEVDSLDLVVVLHPKFSSEGHIPNTLVEMLLQTRIIIGVVMVVGTHIYNTLLQENVQKASSHPIYSR